ncbi:MAG TPA: S24 family peptidase [Thermoanaerobaculia bacterium]|nr:S24 family peptidase [Thermoanaerobaculia bacterium]
MDYTERLRAAVAASGRKHEAIAADAGIAPKTLSRILNGASPKPGFETVVAILHAAGETVGAFLGERGFRLSAAQQKTLGESVAFLQTALLDAAPAPLDARIKPNASLVGQVAKRRATGPPERAQTAREGRAAAGPNRMVDAEPEPPEREIPTHYYSLGARLIYKAEGDSMIDVGITDRDLLFVKPLTEPREADGRLVICLVGGSEYVKQLDLSRNHIRLLSRNGEKYAPMDVDEDADNFQLIGVVIGRSGYPAL